MEVWTEAQEGLGAVNFITGAGGFLQAILFGYGGIRLTLDQLEIMPPSCLPNEAQRLVFHGLKYQGAIFDLTIEKQKYYLDVHINNNNSVPLVYEYEENVFSLTDNTRLSYNTNTRLVIRPATHFCS